MTIDRRTVLLGVAAAGAVAAAVTVTITNHANGESRQRRDVSVYVKRVNAVQNRMHAPLTRVMLAYRDFTAKGGPKKGAAAELRTAAVTLDRLNHRLAQLRAPKEATQLRRLLLALVAQQAALTREVELMARFVPPFQRALARARVASTELGHALAAAPVPKGRKLRGTRKQVQAAQHAYQVHAAAAAGVQADAVDVYDRRIGGVLATLRTLHPPQALAVGYRAQVKALNDVVAAGGALATELRKRDRRDVPVLGRRFTLASREAQTVAAQRAQIAAIRAYNKRAQAVGKAAGDVQSELARLERTLP